MSKPNFKAWRIQAGAKLSLEDMDTEPASSYLDEVDINPLFAKLSKLQSTLYAAKTKGFLLVLQGMDTAGKDGAIRRVFSHVSPLGVHAYAFSAPTDEEKRHDFLRRLAH